MLTKLELFHVGPAPHLILEPARRFNLLTGDNGLGKSFLLEAAWWALTRTWHATPAVPTAPDAYILFEFDSTTKPHRFKASWDKKAQQWKRAAGRPPNPGLVIYARVDGSFSTWDPARNYRLYQRQDGSEAQSPPAYQFTADAVFEGLEREVQEGGAVRRQVLCRGLIDDWTRWAGERDPRFDLLCRLLEHMGPDEQPLRPGKPVRPTVDDERLIPTITMPYGQDVPLTYGPAGVQRMCKLAYLLAWTLAEHKTESERQGRPISDQLILLIDEPETHLHPRWQRTVLPSIVRALREWQGMLIPQVQILAATHSPLVLASMEPEFKPEQDALWKLDLKDGTVTLERDEWERRGDVNGWLTSDVFDLGAPRSTEAEAAIRRAAELMRNDDAEPAAVMAADAELGRVLPEMDAFFVRWRYYMAPKFPSEHA